MQTSARDSAIHAPLFALLAAVLGGCNNDPAATTEGTTDGAPATSTGGESTAATPTTGDSSTGTPTTDGTTTTGGPEPLTRVQQILAALDVAMYQCPERAWPDVAAKYSIRQVLLASELENRAWLWNHQKSDGVPPVVTEGPLDSLPPEWTSVFNINPLDGALTLGISLDWTAEINDGILADGGVLWPDFATALTFHEGFHFLSDQDDWSTGNGSRSAPYPEPWEPRYLRTQLQRALHEEVKSEGAGLAAAAYWHGRLLTEHTAEMTKIRGYDCTEGSAEYVSMMMSAIAELGCDAADPELLALAASHLSDGTFLSEGGFDVGREPYDLGVLAGLILRRAGVPGWELKVEDGEAPVDQAIIGVAPAVQPDDGDVQAAAQAAVAARNATVGAEIEPMLANMKDPAYTRIAVSYNWIAGSFGVGGFYYLAEDPALSEVLLTFSATMEPPSDTVIEISDFTALTAIPTPCALPDGQAIVLAVPTADLAVVGESATITSPKLSFSALAVEATQDADNLPWLCPLDAGGANGLVTPQPGPVLHIVHTPGDSKLVTPRPRASTWTAR